MIAIVVCPSTAEADKLVETASVGLVARIESAVVPLADETGCIARRFEAVCKGRFPQRDTVEPVDFVLGHRAGAVRIAPGQERCAGGGADRRPGVVLPEAGPLGDQPVEMRGPHDAVREDAEIAVPHVVCDDEDQVGT